MSELFNYVDDFVCKIYRFVESASLLVLDWQIKKIKIKVSPESGFI